MATDPIDPSRRANASDEARRAPLAGTRSQTVQRLQVGLFGLGSMVLLVGLANIVMHNARQSEAQVVEAVPVETAPASRPPARDPLADAGVLPDLPARQERQEEGSAVPPDDVPPP